MKQIACVFIVTGLMLCFAGSAFAGVLPTVSIVAIDESVDEATPNTAAFRVVRTDDAGTANELVVDIQLSGVAIEGNMPNGDYEISNVILIDPGVYGAVIPANETVTIVEITPLKDNLVEGTEQATFTIIPGVFNKYEISELGQFSIDVFDDPALVSVKLEEADADEKGPEAGGLSIVRTGGDLTESLIGWIEVTGQATRGDDFTDTNVQVSLAPGLFVEFAENEDNVGIKVVPAADALNEGTETAVYTVVDDLFNSNYLVGAPNSGEISIEDNIAVVSIAADVSLARETGLVAGGVKINRNGDGDPASPLDVLIEIGGSAEVGVDYTVDAEFWDPPNIYRKTIPALATGITLTITPILDMEVEGDEQVDISLSPAQLNNYYPGVSTQSIVTIEDLIDDLFEDSFETP